MIILSSFYHVSKTVSNTISLSNMKCCSLIKKNKDESTTTSVFGSHSSAVLIAYPQQMKLCTMKLGDGAVFHPVIWLYPCEE